VPTAWLDGLEPAAAGTRQLGSDDLVIKPVVGANGQDAFRISPRDDLQRLRRSQRASTAGPACCSPFDNVLAEGEYSLFFFSGE
jgi:hypothetical protein